MVNARRKAKRGKQTTLVFRTWGGARANSGRKAAPERAGFQPHGPRPYFDRHQPALVTLRARAGLPNFRTELVIRIFVAEIRRASAKGFRVLHFSVQSNHLHLLVEAENGLRLSRGMQRLASRVAIAINRLVRRRGALWRDRYHRRDVTTPSQYRNALVYVLFNARKHATGRSRLLQERMLDGCSSAIWHDDWLASSEQFERLHSYRAGPSPVVRPHTWLARTGWHRHGLLTPDEMPRTP